MAEREQRQRRLVGVAHGPARAGDVRAPARQGVVGERHLPDGARPGDRQLSRGVGIAEQRLGDRRSALCPGKPGHQHGLRPIQRRAEFGRPPAEDDERHGRTGLRDRRKQLLLQAGPGQEGARRALPRTIAGLAHHRHDEIGPARRLDRGGKAVVAVADPPAAGRERDLDPGCGTPRAQARENARRVPFLPRALVRPDLIPGGIGERPDHGDAPHAGGIDRQHVAAVLEQHEARARRGAVQIAGLGTQRSSLGARRIENGAVEQAEPELQPQHPAHRRVESGLGDAPGPHLLGQVAQEQAAGHVHVDAREQRLSRGLRVVAGDAVLHQAGHRLPIRHDEAGKAHLTPQQARHQARIGGGGHAVQRGQRRHHSVGARPDAVAEGRQVQVVQLGRGHEGGVVVAPAEHRAVADEVLERAREPAVAESLHLRRGEASGQPRVLAQPLDHPAPAQVAGHVRHRREGPVDAHRRRFAALGGGGAAQQAGIEARRHGQRQREDGAVTVNDVEADEQRDAEARGAGEAVGLRGEPGIVEVDDRPDLAPAEAVEVEDRLVRDQVELAGLLLQRHAGEQCLDPALDGFRCGRSRGEGEGAGRERSDHPRHQPSHRTRPRSGRSSPPSIAGEDHARNEAGPSTVPAPRVRRFVWTAQRAVARPWRPIWRVGTSKPSSHITRSRPASLAR